MPSCFTERDAEAVFEQVHNGLFLSLEVGVDLLAVAVVDEVVCAAGKREQDDVADGFGRLLVALGNEVDEAGRNLEFVAGVVVAFERKCDRLYVVGHTSHWASVPKDAVTCIATNCRFPMVHWSIARVFLHVGDERLCMPTIELEEETVERLDALCVEDESHDELINELINIYEASELTLFRAGD